MTDFLSFCQYLYISKKCGIKIPTRSHLYLIYTIPCTTSCYSLTELWASTLLFQLWQVRMIFDEPEILIGCTNFYWLIFLSSTDLAGLFGKMFFFTWPFCAWILLLLHIYFRCVLHQLTWLKILFHLPMLPTISQKQGKIIIRSFVFLKK